MNIEKILKERKSQESVVVVGDLEFTVKPLTARDEEKLDIDLFRTISETDEDLESIRNDLGDTKSVIKLLGPDKFVDYLYSKKVSKCSMCTGLDEALIEKLSKAELDELFSALEEL